MGNSHNHEHNHAAVIHGHEPHQDPDKEHGREAHIHDHEHRPVAGVGDRPAGWLERVLPGPRKDWNVAEDPATVLTSGHRVTIGG